MGFTTVSNLKSRDLVRSTDRDIIGIHTMEAPEGSQTAEAVANYFKRVQADSHWCIDDNSRVRVIEDWAIAWTLPGANSRSLNIEFAGYARQTTDDWFDAFSVKMLEIGAYSAAEWVIKYGIPIRRLSDSEIRSGAKGFAGHVDVNRVYRQSSHWDPGPAFPWTYFLKRVHAAVTALKGSVPSTPTAPELPNWNNHGYSIAWIRAQQYKLQDLGRGTDLEPLGKLGPQWTRVVKGYQEDRNLDVDGIPGRRTSKALDASLAREFDESPRKPNCKALQRAVRTEDDNVWGSETDTHCDSVRFASEIGGVRFPISVEFTQMVIGAKRDGVWGVKSREALASTTVNFQTALRSMGFDPGPIDGVWGPNTGDAYQLARQACHV